MNDKTRPERPQPARLPQPQFERTPCSYCGRPIVWAVDAKGQRIPLDPTPVVYAVKRGPVDAGGGRVEQGARCKDARDYLVRQPDDVGVAMYVNHFATCRKVEQVKADQAAKKNEQLLLHPTSTEES